MNRKSATMVIILIVTVAGAGIYFLFRPSPCVPPTYEESINAGDFVIQEIHPFADDVSHEFVEIQYRVNQSYELDSWSITNLESEPIALPEINGLDYLAIITIFTGTGTTDSDASDGHSIIYLNLASEMFNDTSGEIAILDESDKVIDYIRYGNKGNTERDVFWDAGDEGIPSIAQNTSAQLFGPDVDSSDNWELAPPTPEALNTLPTTSQDGIPIVLINGIDNILTGAIVVEAGPQVVRRYPGVNLSVCREIHEMVDFTMHLLLDEGYIGPETASDGKLYVDVAQGNENYSTGRASSNGRIRIWIGQKASKTELKATVEHEVAHMFQFAYRPRNGDSQRHYGHPPDTNNWWNEGFADYWGVESAKRNYNKTTEEVHRARQATGGSNWFDHGHDTNTTIFSNWSAESGWDRYQIAYQFMKFLMEEYGEENVSAIYHAIWYDTPTSADNVNAREALEGTLNKTLDEILAEFYLWKTVDREDGDIPESKIHFNITISDDNPSESINETAWTGGAIVQRVVTNGSHPIQIKFGGDTENWTAVVILRLVGGETTNVTLGLNESIVLSPTEVEEVIIIKIRGVDDTGEGITFRAYQDTEEG
jgi:hypothetical protein